VTAAAVLSPSLYLRGEVFQCYTTHAPHLRTDGRPQRPCIATREHLASLMSSRRVSTQGLNRVADSTAGIYEPVPGLLDTLFVPKVARPGARHREILAVVLGFLHTYEPVLGPFFDLRLGAGRAGDPVRFLCAQVHVRSIPTWLTLQRSNAARTTPQALPAHLVKTVHASLGSSACCASIE
jgi:hypothetical protein